ncbi:unnamed protein product, partial [Iphiclides podalirius]
MSRLEELRSMFREKLRRESPEPAGGFDPRDTERLNDDKYLTRVLEHCDGSVEAAAKMLWATMTWRKESKANDIKDVVRMDYVEEGLFFPHGRDLDGCLLLVLRWKQHTRGRRDVDQLKKVVVYWLERLEREEGGRPVTLFFDMEGCGINNVEVDIVVYMITLLKCYYPKFVNQIIIYQMPWIMTAGYKLLRGLLPAPAVQRLRVVTKDKLGEYVHSDQALKCWGGTNDYVFRFVPERGAKKHVTFADGLDTSKGALEVIPGDCLTFDAAGSEVRAGLVIVNSGGGDAAFKIRTTGPEKFKVKPKSGVLAPESRLDVSITVLPGFDAAVAVQERFLVLATSVTGGDGQKSLEEIFQSANVSEFRLKCKLAGKLVSKSPVMDALEKTLNKHSDLCRSVDALKIIQLATLGLTAVTITVSYLVYGRTGNRYC